MISLKSKVTLKILNYYFLNPEAKHYINELAKILELDPKNVHRKLEELEKEGLLISEFQGQERYFFLNQRYALLNHYKEIFLKTIGLEQDIKKCIKSVPKTKEAYIFGSYATNQMDAGSDIDILVIGSHSVLELQKKINKLKKQTGREFNIINLDPNEFDQKKKQKDQFIKNIFNRKIIKVI